MSDSFAVTTSESWFSRITGSIKSVLFGLILFVVSFPVLFFNEGRAVRTAQSLDEGAGAVVSVASDRVDAANEKKLVHMTGTATTTETLRDEEFAVTQNALKLARKVEMYQWVEEKKSETKTKTGGGSETVTTYSYKKDWAPQAIDSSDFQKPEGHANPGPLPAESKTMTASHVTLGAFTLSDAQVAQLEQEVELPVTAAHLAVLPDPFKERAKLHNGAFYLGANPATPAIGDARVSFRAVPPGVASLVARQVGDTFEPYHAKAGDDILLVKDGTASAESMFQAAQAANTTLTWILRAVGFILMFLGLVMIFRPISVLGDVIPIVGTVLGAGLGVFAGAMAAALSVATISVAWLVYRPVLGVALMVVALGLLVGLVMLGRKRRQQAAIAPAAA
jgi:hypothetical protein